MAVLSKQERRALRYAQIQWSGEVEDPRDKRGQRHAHPGVLGLLVAAFACAKVGLVEAEELSEDLGPRLRKKLKLRGKVSDTTLWRLLEQQSPKGFRETLRGLSTPSKASARRSGCCGKEWWSTSASTSR